MAKLSTMPRWLAALAATALALPALPSHAGIDSPPGMAPNAANAVLPDVLDNLGLGAGNDLAFGTLTAQVPGSALTDGASWAVRLNGLAGNLDAASGNQFLATIQAQVSGATGAPADYERAGLLIETSTADPSSSHNLDMVGIDTRCMISNGNSFGHCTGLYTEGSTNGNGDGLLTGLDIEMYNNASTDQATVETPTSKYGFYMVPNGTQNLTAGIILEGNGGGPIYHNGIYIKQPAIGSAAADRAITLVTPGGTEYFAVKKDGTVNTNAAYQVGGTEIASITSGDLHLGAGLSGNVLADKILNATAGLKVNNVTVAATNSYQGNPGNPTGTTSTAGLMMGLAGAVTPTTTGKLLIVISGDIANSISADGGKVQIRYGTGTAPANAAALTGTTCGGLVQYGKASSGGAAVPFSLNCIASGLTLATAYWIDVGLAAITGGTASIADLSISAHEM